jgi:hypothetical protein
MGGMIAEKSVRNVYDDAIELDLGALESPIALKPFD